MVRPVGVLSPVWGSSAVAAGDLRAAVAGVAGGHLATAVLAEPGRESECEVHTRIHYATVRSLLATVVSFSLGRVPCS